VAQLLIKHGSEGDAKTDLGNSALHFAAKQQSLGMTQLLIGHGANTDEIDLNWMDN
jgi:serine/threonine-protein phosphatase 6 regulatory ankyrin repeat subunit A/serine/threonine-protein phosphatase 6 regulatory ankyrin repeat subunit B